VRIELGARSGRGKQAGERIAQRARAGRQPWPRQAQTRGAGEQRPRQLARAGAQLAEWLVAVWVLAACSTQDATRVLGTERQLEPLGPGAPSAEPGAPEAGEVAPLPGSGSGEMAALPGPVGPVGPPDTIFDREHVVEVRVEMDPADWEKLSVEGIGMAEILFPATGFRQVPPYTHFTAARVSVDGVVYENVDVRKKGYIGSLSVIRPSLKLDFESALGGQELVAGNRRMTLNNDLQDPSHVRQCLAYDLFHDAGLPAPRCNYAHVVVNGVDLGTYSHVESVRKPMLRRYFDNVDGNLYEGQLSDFNNATEPYLELESNEEENDRSDLRAVIDALALPDDQVVAALDQLIDLDNFFDFWALETLLGHWDGYSGNSNNYFAYHDPTSDKFFFIPWGADQTFVGDNPLDALPYEITVYAAGSLSNRLYALPDQRARFRQRLGELNDTLWDVPTLLARVEVSSRLARDSESEGLTRVRSYIRNHGEMLRAALAEPAPDWPQAAPGEQQPPDPCQGTFGDIAGSFDTEWGFLADPADVVLNGSEPRPGSAGVEGTRFEGGFRARAGEDGFNPGTASLRIGAPQGDGFYLVIDLSMPLELFEPGYHPLHSFESYGQLALYQPDFDAYVPMGLIGDGGVQLDRASLEPGGKVSGSFTGKVSYFVCPSTIKAFFPPLPQLPPPGPAPVAPPAEPSEPEPPAEAPEQPESSAS
jgi:spore coat protein H